MIWVLMIITAVAVTGNVLWPMIRGAGGRDLAAALGAVTLGAAVSAYIAFGRPGLPDAPIKTEMVGEEDLFELPLAEATRILAARMKERPEDTQGWDLLGGAYMNLGEFRLAADAFSRALHTGGPQGERLSRLGTALVLSEGGQVNDRAAGILKKAVDLGAEGPEAPFFLAVYDETKGRPEAALAAYEDLLATVESPFWQARIAQRMAGLEQDRASPGAGAASSMPALSDEARTAASGMDAAAQQQMIRGMVEGLAGRLAENPSDWQGWLRLARARAVLGEAEAAREAARQAVARAPADQTAAVIAELEALGLDVPAEQ